MSPLLSAMPVFTDPLVISPLISPLAIVWLKLLFNTNLLASITLLALAYEQVYAMCFVNDDGVKIAEQKMMIMHSANLPAMFLPHKYSRTRYR